MALRSAPKRKIDLEKLDELQKEIFGLREKSDAEKDGVEAKNRKKTPRHSGMEKQETPITVERLKAVETVELHTKKKKGENTENIGIKENLELKKNVDGIGWNLRSLETIAERITVSKAGQGRNTTRPFSLPRTLIIDTTRLKAKFRTIDEQFTQNVIVDFLLREALGHATPENYRDLRAEALEFVKRAEETTRRSLTVTEEVVYQMSELKAGINLETGKKFSNDEIFSTLLAIGVSWLYRNGVLN